MSTSSADQNVQAAPAGKIPLRRNATPLAEAVRRHGFSALAAVSVSTTLVLFGFYIARVWPFTIDDAFITFRYSKMFASGSGPTFNEGMHHVEGYTTFLWMVVMTVPNLIGISPVLFAKIIGIAMTLGTMTLAWLVVDRYSPLTATPLRFLVGATPVFIIALFPPTAVHAVAGMETPLYTFALTLFLATVALFRRFSPRRGAMLVGLSGLLLGLIRPEGNLVVVVGVVTLLAINSDRRKRLLGSTLLFYVVPGLTYFAWRYSYYGHPFPLPYYLKLGHQQFMAGRGAVKGFVLLLVWFLPLAALGIFGRAWRQLLPAAIAAGSLLAFFTFPQFWTAYEWRFLYPVLPFGAALFGIGLARFLSFWIAAPRERRSLRWLAAGGVAMLLILGMRNITHATAAQLRLYHWDGASSNLVREEFGRYLANFQPPGRRHVLTVSDAGAIPYYSGWTTVDTLGLNDDHIAITQTHDAGYVLSFHPDLVIITTGSPGSDSLDRGGAETDFSPQFPHDEPLFRAASKQGMRRVLSLRVTPQFWYWVLAKPGTPLARYLQDWEQVPLAPRPPRAGNNPVLGG